MKLDKIKFGRLVAFLSRNGFDGYEDNIQCLDDMIEIDIPKQEYVEVAKVDELLRQLNAHDGFIPAIKAYRVLTGAGLKESKEAIERYRSIPKFPVKEDEKVNQEPATLGDILGKVK